MKRIAFWQIARQACGAAVLVLQPLSRLTAWLANRARAGEAWADIEVLRATAQHRIAQRTGAPR